MLEMGTFCTIFHLVKISLVWAAICTLNNATATILDVFYKDLTVHAIGQTKANRSACYNAGAIVDSISSEPWEWKDLVMAEKSQKPMSYFFKQRKQCESCSWRFEWCQWSNKKNAAKAERKFQPRWLKATRGWIMIKKTTGWSAVYLSMFG